MSTHLVTMANEITAFFGPISDRAEAAKSVAAHLRLYWDPRMRKQIVDYVMRGGEGLFPIARAAIELLVVESAVD
jgi:formate dehydrogenase subunit delta